MVLSPMAGYSDSPYRLLTREAGSALSITEFVAAESLARGSQKALDLLRYREAERPVIFQIFSDNPDAIEAAIRRIEPLKPDGINLNMGCSARTVSGRGAGAGLLRRPDLVRIILERMKRTASLPLSAKIRLGWDAGSRNYADISAMVEDAGFTFLAVHGRTRDMQYSGSADWDAIGEIAAGLRIPVYGNGDIRSAHDAARKIADYGVAGVFIGRGAMGNPWIFSGRSRNDLTTEEKMPVILRHLQLMAETYGEEQGAVLFRKHMVKYLSAELRKDETNPSENAMRDRLLSLEHSGELAGELRSIFSGVPASGSAA